MSVNLDLVWQHAEEAAFLWSQRNAAVNQPHYRLADLKACDERLDANLEGIAPLSFPTGNRPLLRLSPTRDHVAL